MKKNFGLYSIIWAFCLVIFNIIVFITPNRVAELNKFGGAFWVGYIFITIAFIGQLVCVFFAFKDKDLNKFFYKLPLLSISYTGLILMLIVGTACMSIPNLPNWIGIIVCVSIIAFNAIAIIKATTAADIVSGIDEKIKTQTFFIKSLTADAETLMKSAKSDSVKTECRKVYEALRYSDPMSKDVLASTESQIKIKISELSEAVKMDDSKKVAEMVNEVVILIEDRNKKCKLLK